jgi:hypothetical protein
LGFNVETLKFGRSGVWTLEVGEAVDCSEFKLLIDFHARKGVKLVKARRRVGKLDKVACYRAITINSYLEE